MRFVVAFGLAAVLTPMARIVAPTLGLVDRPAPGSLKIHDSPVPLVGGPAALLAAAAALWAAGALPPTWIVLAVLGAMIVGLIDDAQPLPVLPRFVALAAIGVVVGVVASDGWPMAIVAVGITLACANAVNIMDGQDGLAGGLVVTAALGLAVAGPAAGVEPSLAVAGGVAAFVCWNISPVRVFMGNGGAYALGTALAASATHAVNADGLRAAFVAGLCLGPFVFELTLTVLRRARAGGGLTPGDRLHSYDLLAARSPRRRVTVGFWLVGVVASGLGILAANASLAGASAIAIVAAVVAVPVGRLVWPGRIPMVEGG